eukprot:Opistho-2@87166
MRDCKLQTQYSRDLQYGQARFHLLVIPRTLISGPECLTREHVGILEKLQRKGTELITRENTSRSDESRRRFRMGFHGIPSMNQLHMHVISQDFDSDCLKTKQHWNSFASPFFLDSADVIDTIKAKGHMEIDRAAFERLLTSPLRCHLCAEECKTMPSLKSHLKTHC